MTQIQETAGEKWSGLRDWWSDQSAGMRRGVVIGAAAVLALAIGLAVWALVPRRSPPKLDDPLAVARFVAKYDFRKLPSDQKRPYMQAARKQLKTIEAARRDGRLAPEAYRAAYVCSWMERRLEDMQDYYKLPPAARTVYLDEMLGHADEGAVKAAAKAAKSKSSAPPVVPVAAAADAGKKDKDPKAAKSPADDSLLYANDQEKQAFDAQKEQFEDDFLEGWPADRRAQWEQFRQAYKDRRQQWAARGSAAVPK